MSHPWHGARSFDRLFLSNVGRASLAFGSLRAEITRDAAKRVGENIVFRERERTTPLHWPALLRSARLQQQRTDRESEQKGAPQHRHVQQQQERPPARARHRWIWRWSWRRVASAVTQWDSTPFVGVLPWPCRCSPKRAAKEPVQGEDETGWCPHRWRRGLAAAPTGRRREQHPGRGPSQVRCCLFVCCYSLTARLT